MRIITIPVLYCSSIQVFVLTRNLSLFRSSTLSTWLHSDLNPNPHLTDQLPSFLAMHLIPAHFLLPGNNLVKLLSRVLTFLLHIPLSFLSPSRSIRSLPSVTSLTLACLYSQVRLHPISQGQCEVKECQRFLYVTKYMNTLMKIKK